MATPMDTVCTEDIGYSLVHLYCFLMYFDVPNLNHLNIKKLSTKNEYKFTYLSLADQTDCSLRLHVQTKQPKPSIQTEKK